jgi:hypothetical protein
MGWIPKTWKELFNNCVILMLTFGSIGIALKFTTFFDKWVFFPFFPNILDAAFIILSVIYLSLKSRK